jgi:hypothetical protein
VLQGAAQNAMVTMQDFFSLGAMSITGQAGQMRAAIDTQTEGVKALGSAMMNYHSLQGSVADQSDTPTAFGGRSGRVEQHLSPLGRVQAQWASFWDKLKVSPAHPIDTGGADVGGEPLPGVPGKAKGAKGAQQLTIEHLKDSLVPYQAAIAQTKRNIKELQDSLQALGDIDTNEKAYLAQRLYNKELQQSKVLVTDIHNLMRQQEVVRTKLVGDAAKTRDPHTKETYAHAAAGLQVLIGNEQGAVNAANAEADKVRIEAAKKLLEYHKAMLDAQNTQSELAVKGTEEAGQRAMALRNVQVAAPTTTAAGEAAARAKELADAQEAITEATDTHTIAEQKAATESQILADTLRIYGHGSIEALTAQNNLTQATQAAYTAETTIEAANQQYQNKLLQTSAAVETTRKGFDSIAQEVSGPLYKAFETIQQGINPLTALFLSLFTKTQSFDDIVAVAARIVEQLALVFNALRPIIDLLLGVLIGIVDVFLELYNLIADMLSVFGIHLQKISLINTALGDLDNGLENTTQLLTVTHDLPTINQYNAGQWDNLAAKQTQANDLANAEKGILSAGFNQSIAKFGEIIGVLLAMKAILMIIEAKGVISAAFNSGGGVIGFFKSLLGIGTASTTAGGPGNDMPPVLTDEQALAQNVAADEIQQVSLAEDAANTAETLAVNPLPVTLTEDQALAGNVAASSVDLQASLQASIDANTAGLGDNVNAISGGGAGSSGSGGGLMGSLGGVGKIMGGLMDAYGIYSGFKQGGVTGGVEAGFSADSLAMLLGATGPIGIIAGVAVGLTSLLFGGSNPLIGPKPANEPDIYQTGTWGQDNANLWGAGTGQFANTPMNANGQQFAMSSSLSQQTGGLGLLQYIASYMQQGGTALPAQLAAAFKGLNTTGTDITSGKNGNLTLANGQTFNYNTLYQMAMQAFTAIQNAGGLLSAASGDLSNSATAIGYAVNGATVTADNGMTIIPGSSTPAGGVVGSLPGTTGSLTESIVTALNSFVTQFGQAVPLFVSAVSTFNVAKMMGNGNAVTSTGAGQVNVSAPTVEAGAGGAAGDINITIGQVVGTDPTQLKTTFKQVFDDLQQEGSIQAMISTRTRQFGVGVNTPR